MLVVVAGAMVRRDDLLVFGLVVRLVNVLTLAIRSTRGSPTPDVATGWMPVAKSGVPAPEATVEPPQPFAHGRVATALRAAG